MVYRISSLVLAGLAGGAISQITPEMIDVSGKTAIGIIGAVVGGIVTLMSKQAKSQREDRQQLADAMQALIATFGAADEEKGNGRSRLLVEQTHGMTQELSNTLGRLAKSMERLDSDSGRRLKFMERIEGTLHEIKKTNVEVRRYLKALTVEGNH